MTNGLSILPPTPVLIINIALSLVAITPTPVLLALAGKLVNALLIALGVWEAHFKVSVMDPLIALKSDFLAWTPVAAIIALVSNIWSFSSKIIHVVWEWRRVLMVSIFALIAVTLEPDILGILATLIVDTVESTAEVVERTTSTFATGHSPHLGDSPSALTARRLLMPPVSEKYSRIPEDWYDKPLHLPTKDDDLRSIASKLEDLRAVVQGGQSLGRATHWKWIEDGTGLEACWIEKNLTHEEFTQDMAWENGASPPPVDWDARTNTLVYWCRSIFGIRIKASDDLIPALQTLYPRRPIRPRHAYCFYTRHRDVLPLARAIKKPHRVGLVFVKEVALWTSVHKAEWLTVRRAAETCRLGKDLNSSNKYVESIRISIRVLRIREQSLKWQVAAYEERLRSQEFV
ncbi:hypothetical protein BCV69DRAFT_283443 [Microstroma glucosiphilum]|uniref:Uncharacterized protein n=1 Tax=Pseudomicrostroma glucosiphilum TaxID=1684307 RepID=A0A316U506_9BASI|nr:hypothetical protein BCV69DRAFT_283443 [Pseudomicrostroma glucosiphilum]PWN19914.1 hypothetical protein BCV69DRAFT_283443 [Pseudomicrostroma glucosiphilum]